MKHFFNAKRLLTAGVVFFVSLGFIGLSTGMWFQVDTDFNVIRSVLSPVDTVLAQPRLWFSSHFENVENLLETYRQNKVLKQKLWQLEQRLRDNQSTLEENKSLRSSLALLEMGQELNSLVVEVISREPSTWSNRLTVSKGSQAGVSVYDLALANGGVIGFVSDVKKETATVQLLTNAEASFGLAVKFSSNQSIYGVLTAYDEKEQAYVIMQLTSQEGLEVGTSVVTSDLSDRYRGNFLLGEVVSIKQDKNTLETSVYVKPASDFDGIYSLVLIGGGKQ